MPTFPSPPARVEAVARSARGPRSRSRCVRAWPHYTPPLAPPHPTGVKDAALLNTINTTTTLAKHLHKEAAGGAILATFAAIFFRTLQSVFGWSFFRTFMDFFVTIFGLCDAPQGLLCVYCVSLDGVDPWDCSRGPYV